MAQITTVIFDMDGLLIDSEPLWKEAADEVFDELDILLTKEQYLHTTGMRTYEFLEYWLREHEQPLDDIAFLHNKIVEIVIAKINQRGEPMKGALGLIRSFKAAGFKIGIASSSPINMIEAVVQKMGIGDMVDVLSSAEDLDYGKPHPQVFMECAKALGVRADSCIVFEDSFHGMIAAKAARMYCVVVPAPELFHEKRWFAADQKLNSLEDFDMHSFNG